ncbi:MAG: hypothetical protein ACX930_03170 [Erythrobacter sp.]
MKTLIALSSATAFCFAAAVTTTAVADDTTATETEERAVVVATNDRGKATQVRINGKIIDVCMNEAQDNCINPRAAGLNWGDRPLEYWPGKSESSQ